MACCHACHSLVIAMFAVSRKRQAGFKNQASSIVGGFKPRLDAATTFQDS